MEKRNFIRVVVLLAVLVIPLQIGNPWAVVHAERNSSAIELLEVKDSVECFLSAVAVNGRPIEPTHSPQANAGDVITFQLRIQNRMVFPLFDIRNRLEWGTGLVYEGNMDRENMMGRFDDVENEISLSIAEIRPQREKIEYSCLFDLKVVGCEGLTVHVRPEEIYSRQKLQSHPVAVHMKSADILCEIATSHAKSDADGKTAVKVDIRNTGDGDASEFLLDTDFEDIPVSIANVAGPFHYDAKSGAFRLEEKLRPGQSLSLRFTAESSAENKDRAALPSHVRFAPVFKNECGMLSFAPAKLAVWNLGREASGESVRRGRGTKNQAGEFSADGSLFVAGLSDDSGEISKTPAPIRTVVGHSTQSAISEYATTASNNADLAMNVAPDIFRIESKDAPLTWTVYVTNKGAEIARDVRLQDNLGDNLRYDNSKIDGMPANARLERDAPNYGNTSVSWELGDLGPDETREVTITAYPSDMKNLVASGYGNTLALSSGQEGGGELVADSDTPQFILPVETEASVESEGSIEGDEVFGGCGNIHVFFSMTQMYKSNLYRTKDDKEDVWATYLTPGLWAAIPGSCERIVEVVTASATPGGLVVSPFYPQTNRRYQGYFLYSPQAEFYWDKSDENMVSQRVDAYFRYQTMNKFSFRALDQFKYSHDSISSRALTIDDRYTSNLLNVVGTYDPTAKLGLRLDYSNFLLDYSSSENSRADRMDNSASAYVFFRFSSKTSIFANLEYSDIDYDETDFDSEEYRYYAGFRWEITDKTSGQLKGGYGTRSYDQSGLGDADSWMAELQIDYAYSPRTHIVLNAFRRYDEPIGEIVNKDDVEGNFTKYILTNFVGLAVNYDLTSKLHLNLDTTVFYDEYEDEERLSSQKQREDWEYAISPSVKYDFRDWLTFDFAYIYTKRDSNYSEYDFDDHTVMLRGSVYQ